ncbi:hypothetical protein [Xenorhabdus mauleonii]|uniref:endonuclease toxin domain-containing protein n=1 Tax=Xenorhabdus mauleonii TaxID=351675 RepID=UPI000B8537C0|nr:hypothetical protein [Xenorhabdus mauleonii]
MKLSFGYGSGHFGGYGKLNSYVNEILEFQATIKGEFKITNAMIQKKTMHLAVPEKTAPAQWVEINKSINYAADKNIDIKLILQHK